MREFIEDLKQEGELIEVDTQVDWNLEMGAVARRLSELGLGRSVKKGGVPAVVFNNIKGYPGHRISALTHASPKRLAMMFGLKGLDLEKATLNEVQDLYLESLDNPIKPVVVSEKDAPCKENKVFGEGCNLFDFPAPMVHEGDGGRYMCTFHLVAQKDPDTDWTNWGMYRAMVYDRRTLTGTMVPFQQGPSIYYEKYESKDEAMPFAIVIGSEPLSLFFAACPVPRGISEMDIVGGARKKPLEVVKCETSDILVPASSEIVIEGIIPPKIRAYEGPFGEYCGYRVGGRDLRPLYVVKAITYRSNPIQSMSNMGVPVDDGDMLWGVGLGGAIKRDLKRNNIPIRAINILPESSVNLLVISTETPYPRIPQRIMAIVFSNPMSIGVSSYLVVNEDVDVFNTAEVIHAWTSRVHPERDIHIYHQLGNPSCPFATKEERAKMTAPQILYDGTWPLDWPKDNIPPVCSFKKIYPKEIQEVVLKRWKEYGFGES